MRVCGERDLDKPNTYVASGKVLSVLCSQKNTYQSSAHGDLLQNKTFRQYKSHSHTIILVSIISK